MLELLKYFYRSKLFFSIVSFPIKLFDFMNFSKRDEIVFYGYHGRYNGNAKALYEYYLKIDSELKPVWLLDSRDCDLDIDKSKVYFLPSKKSSLLEHFKFLFKLHKAKVIVVTSVGDLHIYRMLLLKKKHKEVLLPHGISLKLNGIMAKHLDKEQKKIWIDIPKRFDMISVASRIDKYSISSGFRFDPNKIKITGPQRRDNQITSISYKQKLDIKKELLKKIKLESKISNETNLLLYAPTHRDHKVVDYTFSLLENIENFDLNDLNDYLVKKNTVLFLREHMVSKYDKDKIKDDVKSLKNIFFLTPQLLPEVESFVLAFDVIITDYSGIYLEWLESGISLAFIPFDLKEYKEKRGLTLPDNIMYPGPLILSQSDFYEYLDHMKIQDEKYKEKRIFLSSLLFEVPKDNSCKLTELEIERLLEND